MAGPSSGQCRAARLRHQRSARQSRVGVPDAATTVRSRAVPKYAGPFWMSTSDAAARIGVTVRTLYRIIDQGEVTAYKVARLIRLRTVEVEAYCGDRRDDSSD